MGIQSGNSAGRNEDTRDVPGSVQRQSRPRLRVLRHHRLHAFCGRGTRMPEGLRRRNGHDGSCGDCPPGSHGQGDCRFSCREGRALPAVCTRAPADGRACADGSQDIGECDPAAPQRT
ncbi:hypothetical protein [Phocaeicola coprocola]|uniref:hypothetical protein n=1 Tax=Phocaeicola coprocola TaxID=310298 RepID=UPI0020CABC3B|nr:hypothetical protein [Phocaeicola coprocola]